MELEKLLEEVIGLILARVLIVLLLLLILLCKFHRAVQSILKAAGRDIFELEVAHHGYGISLGILKLRVNTLLLRVS